MLFFKKRRKKEKDRFYLTSNPTLLQKIRALIIALQSHEIYSKQIDDLTEARSRLGNDQMGEKERKRLERFFTKNEIPLK